MSTPAPSVALAHRDPLGARLGMWLFLFTELLLFAGLFLLYAVYRARFPEDFHYGASTLDTAVGAINTVILLTSSLTMALSIAALRHDRARPARGLLAATMLLGLLFLVNKGFEWSSKIGHGLYPNSEELLGHTYGENIFYAIYYAMTGLHALHVLVGLAILGVMLGLLRPRRLGPAAGTQGRATDTPGAAGSARVTTADTLREGVAGKIENAGLYWHLVDIIWIFLFPLFYLIS